MDVPANKHIAFVKHVGKGVVAVCVIALGFLLGCEDRLCAAPGLDERAFETADVIMCDVVVRANGTKVHWRGPLPQSIKMDLKLDPRFHVPGRIEALNVYISRPFRYALTSGYAERLKGVEPVPTLYDVPPDMTVYLLPPFEVSFAIRLDGATFLGHEVFANCERDAIIFNGRGIRQCRIQSPITDKTYVDILFYDDNYPPETWRETLKAVEAGIRGIITLKNDKAA